jgi:hypothetical protein
VNDPHDPHGPSDFTSIQGETNVSIRLASRRSAVVGLAVTTVIAGGVAAYAYPPSSPLTVEAAPQSNGSTLITINNANPNCDFDVRVDGGTPARTTLPRNGTTVLTATFAVTGTKDHDVRVKAVNCTKGTDKEHARTQFVIPNVQVSGPATADAGKYYRVNVTGVQDGTEVTLMATGPGGAMATDIRSDDANGRGEAKPRVKLPSAGNWTVTAVAGGTSIGSVNTTAN